MDGGSDRLMSNEQGWVETKNGWCILGLVGGSTGRRARERAKNDLDLAMLLMNDADL